jgi:hypothetical protein
MQKTRKRKTRKRKTRKRNLFGGGKQEIHFYIAKNKSHCNGKNCSLVLINNGKREKMYISKNNAKIDKLYDLVKKFRNEFTILFVYDKVSNINN